jgi:hypothetical protein
MLPHVDESESRHSMGMRAKQSCSPVPTLSVLNVVKFVCM